MDVNLSLIENKNQFKKAMNKTIVNSISFYHILLISSHLSLFHAISMARYSNVQIILRIPPTFNVQWEGMEDQQSQTLRPL